MRGRKSGERTWKKRTKARSSRRLVGKVRKWEDGKQRNPKEKREETTGKSHKSQETLKTLLTNRKLRI